MTYQPNKIRAAWVDIAKGIGIILVVYGHVSRGLMNSGIGTNNTVLQIADSIIYSFHMPLFFFLSGLFFTQSLEKYGGKGLVINKLSTLIYPYIIWSFLQGFIEVFLSHYTNKGIHFSEILTLLWQPRAQFWFLYALFFVTLTSIPIYTKTRSYSAIIVAAAALYLFAPSLPNVAALKEVAFNLVFFSAGIFFHNKFPDPKSSTILTISLGLVFLVSQGYLHIEPGNDIGDGGKPVGLLLTLISIGFVVLLCINIAKYHFSWLQYLGKHSMEIYLMHILAASGIRIALTKVMGITNLSIHLAIGTIAGLALPLLATIAIKQLRMGILLTPPQKLIFSTRS